MLLNLINHQQPDIDKIYLYIKNLFKSKYQLLINGREKVGIEILKNPEALISKCYKCSVRLVLKVV